MAKHEVDALWQKLCDDYYAARDAHFEAWYAVMPTFCAIGSGVSSDSRSDYEFAKYESTREAWLDIRRRMDEFAKLHSRAAHSTD